MKQIQERNKSEVVIFSNLLKTSLGDVTNDGTLGKKLKDLENRKYKINLKASRPKLLLNRKNLNKTEIQITKIDLSLKINRSFIIIYK